MRYEYTITPEINLFHFLIDKLEITPESKALQKQFEQYEKEHPDDYYLEDMENFAEEEKDKDTDVFTINSYNDEYNMLSQGIQYVGFHKNDKDFVILQIHGGADIRGGYTEPHIFETEDMYSLYDSAVYAKVKDKEWEWEDGSWHSLDSDEPEEEGIPKTWEVIEDKVFYKPTGEPISFYISNPNASQWWMKDKNLVARWAPTMDKNQRTLKKQRMRA
jgi:hypothetical protein